ncbi:DUF1293 domain-containing protein [Vibrio sinaloensis]|uniref:DUF1293 domain-containing protein n=1 Tax=Photobacterium sp. (strain ATCC 43367) TaxID=379097 RepID=UPI00057D0E04|nr:DUF1293 domain-containing protein [Vibrio sinaloensis]KHT38049.1 VSK-int [Vibrio sinaloensis]
MAVIITGIAVKRFPKSGQEMAELSVLRQVETVNVEKFEQYGIGFNTDIPFNKQALKMDVGYAKKLIETRAFVPNSNYELSFGANPDDPLEILVTELKPEDDGVKKHFAESLKAGA